MRRYELMLLLRPDLEDDKLQSAVEKVTRAIVNAGGSLSKVSPWGKRRLAYEIQHLRDASYFLIHFDIDPSEVRGIERGLLISEEILRHLVIVLEDRRAGAEDEELVPAVAERQPEAGDPAAQAPSEPSEGQSVDYDGEIAEAPEAEGTETPGPAEPAEQPVAKA
ncbi:MAG: 30S ribosomal protein S6 [Chloroflexota bacterium]|nr:30S ribosomal protein S6 [Chloroflexota bacterium]